MRAFEDVGGQPRYRKCLASREAEDEDGRPDWVVSFDARSDPDRRGCRELQGLDLGSRRGGSEQLCDQGRGPLQTPSSYVPQWGSRLVRTVEVVDEETWPKEVKLSSRT